MMQKWKLGFMELSSVFSLFLLLSNFLGDFFWINKDFCVHIYIIYKFLAEK